MLCRLCVNESSDFINIFQNNDHKIDIPNLINLYFTFQVSQDDQHSKIVCRNCLDSLHKFNIFCQSIEEAQDKWKILVDCEQKDIKNEDHSIDETDLTNDSYLNFNNNVQDVKKEQIKLPLPSFHTDQTVVDDDVNELKEHDLKIESSNKKNKQSNEPTKSEKRSLLSKQFDRLIAENSNLICNECNEPMENFKILKRHFKVTHGKTGFMICCQRKFFRAADLADHINLHLNPSYFKCDECNKCFSGRYSLDFHRKTCHAKEEEKLSFKCKHCSRKFITQSVRDKHEKDHDLIQTDGTKHICTECGKSFPNELKYKSHHFNVHKTVYSRMCHLCGKTVRGDKALERHQLQHAGINLKVQCNICGAELSTKGILKAHMIALHPEDSSITYECSICGKISPSQRALKNHMDYVHKCERTHKCNLCEKSFKKFQALKEHITRHTGDRLYECPHCPKTFKVRSNMHHHRKIKHPKEFQENRRKHMISK